MFFNARCHRTREGGRPVGTAPSGRKAIGGQAMTLLLRKRNAQGREPFGWKDHDFAVLDDEVRIGRMS